jgi:hypothetical protein
MYKLWFISPDRLAVIITDYPQIQFNRTEPETSHPILVVTRTRTRTRRRRRRTWQKLTLTAHYHSDQRNCYAADLITILDDSDVAIKNGLDATIS